MGMWSGNFNRIGGNNTRFLKNVKSQMNVVMAIMLIAILLATTVFFWRTSETFSKSYSTEIDKKSFETVSTYIENVVAHNEIAWIERTLVETNLTIPMPYDELNGSYVGENELFKIRYINSNTIRLSSKDESGIIVDTKDVLLNTRVYIDGDYVLYSNPSVPDLKDKNIIGDFLYLKLENLNTGKTNQYVAYLNPTFKSSVVGNAGEPPESLAKTCFLLEYPQSEWSQYYDSRANTYSVYPSNYYILDVEDSGIDPRYIGYYTNIVVPSNSTMIDDLSSYKQILSDYVQSGGSIILLSQNPDDKTRYEFLPINVIYDSGKYDTIGVSKQHSITTNLSPYEIAGSYYSAEGTILEPYFDQPGVDILLRETPYNTHDNSNPALVLGSWGAGKVIATTIPIDYKAVLDTNTTVCSWWDPGSLGGGYDWHFRRLVVVDAGDVNRVNEPIEIIIDPTDEINKLSKEGLLDLENTNLDLNSIRVVELIGGDCFDKVAIPSQSYMYRPNLENPATYICAPLDTIEHTLLFELDSPARIKVDMFLDPNTYSKDETSIRNEFRVKVNDVWVTDPIDFQVLYENAGNRPGAGYWNAQDTSCAGGEGCQGPRHYEIEIPEKYFHKGDNKIVVSMAHLAVNSLTWYRNVQFSLLYYDQLTNRYILFWREYEPMYIYFSMGSTAATTGSSYSTTPKGGKRYYEIYFDILENPPIKDNPTYRVEDDAVSLLWSNKIEGNISFPSISGLSSLAYPRIWNISSPSTKDIDEDGDIDVVIGLRDGNVALVDGPSGALLWKRPFDRVRPYTGVGPYNVYGLSISGSPAVADIDNDDHYEIIGGSTNIRAEVDTAGGYVNIYLIDTNLTVLDHNGNIEWKYPLTGSVVSAPAIGDINNDGYDDIVIQTLECSGIRYQYRPTVVIPDYNRNVSVRNHLYVISGRTHGLLWHTTENAGSYRMRYFASIVSGKINLMFPSSSPALGDIDGNDNYALEIVTGNVDGYAYAYEHTGPPYKWRSNVNANITGDFTGLMGYVVSSPAITRTNNRKNYDDAIMTFLRDGGDVLYGYILDGRNGTNTEITALNDQTARHPAGHPVVSWPEGYHHRGPQVAIPMNQYLCIEHLAQTHPVHGLITQDGTVTTSYATPAIIESNNFSSDLRTYETGHYDVILGAENGRVYALSYTDTTSGVDNGNNENEINFNNKVKRLWYYQVGSPIRSSVAVDDIDNDGLSEVVFISDNGFLTSLNIANNYSNWPTERLNLYRGGDTETNLDGPTTTMALTETIDYGDTLNPYDDRYRVNADFNLSYPSAGNIFYSYVANDWLKIDTNHNTLVSDEIVLYPRDLTQLKIETYESKNVDRTYAIESIYGDIIGGEYVVTFYDRGMMKLFDNIMAYTSAPTRNIQIEGGIWVNLDLPNEIGGHEYVIQGLGDSIRIYAPDAPEISYEKPLDGISIYGTVSSISKNKYIVITSYGAYLSPNPEG